MLGKRRWLSVLLVASMATFGFGMAAGADTASETGFVAEINATRAANGLGSLTVDGGLRDWGRVHTGHMMDADEIYHSTESELKAAGGTGWSKIGENVGRGGTVSSLHAAFMNSPGHKANILGDYNYVGVGTGTKDGVLYVSVLFMKKGSTSTPTTTIPPATTTTSGSAATTQPETARTPTTTQPTVSTTTTIPATTTTTMIVGPDMPVTPGESCIDATRFWWTCHD
jgi:hypothetical protein